MGDIAVQTKNNVKFSTFSKEPYICVTSNSSWKDDTNKLINDVSEIMVQKDEKTGECSKTYSFYSRDFNKMIREGKFSVFEQQSSPEYASKYEDRCYQIDNAFLLNDFTKNPSSASEISELFISNGEGNIYVNILNKEGLISNLVQNDIYSSKEQTMINEHLQNIKLVKKISSIQDSDFAQNSGQQDEFLYIVGFSQLFIFLSSVWLDSLSLGTLSSDLASYEIKLSPGFCPFVFQFSDLGNEDIQQRTIRQRHSQIYKALYNFFDEQNFTTIQFYSLFNIYQKVDPTDPASFEIFKVGENGVRIVAISKIVYIFIFIAVLYFIIYQVIIVFTDSIKNKIDVDREKIYFHFYQNNLKQNKYLNNELKTNLKDMPKQINLAQIHVIDYAKLSSEDKFVEEEQSQEEKQSFSDKKYICAFQTKNPLIHYSFQALCTEGFAWLQQRQLSSLTIFYKELFILQESEFELNKDNQMNIFQISVQDLKKMYHLFCYYFDLEIESLFSEKGVSALPDGFRLVYDQTIVFQQKPNNLEKDEFPIELDYEIILNKLQNQPEMKLSKFYYQYNTQREVDDKEKPLTKEFYIKSNKKLVIARQPGSKKIMINQNFISNFSEIFTDFLSSPDSQKDPSNTQNKESKDAQSNLQKIINSLNKSYFSFQFGTQNSRLIFQHIGTILRSVVLQVIYLVSPFIFCGLSLAFMIIYDGAERKLLNNSFFNKDSFFKNKSLPAKLITFDVPLFSLLALGIIIFIVSFYAQLIVRNTFSFTELAKNSQIGYQLEYQREKNEEFKKNNIQRKSIFMYIILIISLILLLVQITYVCGAFIILVISSVVFSKLQIPVVIFCGVLIVTIIQTITTFNSQKQEGEKLLKEKFVTNLRIAFEKLQASNKENKELPSKITNKKDDKVISKFYQSDLNHYASEYQDMFSFITQNEASQIDGYKFEAFLQSIRMDLNEVQLNQLYSHVKYDKQGGEKFYSIRLWKLDKNLNLVEFNKAIEFIINQKIIQALKVLDISYASLYLSLVGTILQSILIAFLIFSIFTGLINQDAEFDFASNSFVSIGGVLGIQVSKEDKGSLLSDEKVMDKTVEDIEKQTHEYN